MDRNFDWNSIRNNAHRNNAHTSTVEFLTSQLWINEMNDTLANIEGTGVEIIELDSMNNTLTSSEDPYENVQNLSHGWSYVNTNRFQELENNYKVNRQARLKRRLTNRNSTANDSVASEFDDSFYFNSTDCKNSTIDSDDVVTLNQQTNCFTILNKHSALELDSSSEESNDPDNQATRCGDIVLESNQNTDEVNYKSGLEEKHTIWIYSFKNRHLLSENDLEINIPCHSASSTSCSPEHVEEEINTGTVTHVGRVASPIPRPCIPRLNLSLTATLPNVSEVSEPKSPPIFNKDKLYKPKAVNGWFLDNSEKPEYAAKHDKSTNIVNWMALSPRERRRRSRHTHLDIQNITQLLPVSEIDSNTEVKSQNSEQNVKTTQTNLDVKVQSQNKSQSTTDQLTDTTTTLESTMEDRGDYNKGGQRPHITFQRKQLIGSPITEPLDKLDSNNWIAEHEPKSRHEYEPTAIDDENQRARGDTGLTSAGDRLMFRNMSLLKPAEWGEYSPIAGSHLSLQLSLGPDSDTERATFLQRCFNCFKCCKYK